MTKFLELVLSGVSLGFIYALLAMGFVIIFKATEVVNFAHGSILLFGVYVIADYRDRLGFYGAVLLGLAVAGALVVLVERVLINPLRGAELNALAILTIGLDVILLAALTKLIGDKILSTGDPFGADVTQLAGFTIADNRIAAIVVALVLISAFFALFKYSSWGIAMRAAAEDGEAASLMGIRRGRVSAIAWLTAGILATVAGIFLAGSPAPGLTATSGFTAIRAFPAAILGGLDSVGGAVVGGILIGLAESLTAGYESDLLFLGRGFSSVMPYVVMIAILLWRPSGLFGTKELTRV